jgi:anaerobic dimethyl sulfoxide reductase subunit B (iron-sulfur subunit)
MCCVTACKDKNALSVGYNFRHVDDFNSGTYPAVRAAGLSLACNHCAVPACQAVCPVEAIVKSDETGLVAINEDLCIGCGSCVTACPYKAPILLEAGDKAGKCDGCRSFLEQGWKVACVGACSTRCLDFGDLEELKARYGSDLVLQTADMPDPSMTDPSILIKAKPM